jgi:type II secretory pathway pseudopilin PulG
MAELMVVLGIFGLMLAIGALNFRGAPQKASIKSAAELLASEMRAARSRAVATGRPVAVAFPRPGGVPISQGFYTLAGHQNPTLVKVQDFSEEFPDTQIFLGHWNAGAGPAFRADPAEFDAAAWGAPRVQDSHIQFLPNGEARSNQPSLNNAFQIVVGRDVEANSDRLDGVASFELQNAADAFTISVGRSGQINVARGVVRGEAVATAESSVQHDFRMPALAVNSTNSSPRNLRVKAFPVPVDETLPPGVDAVVRENGTLSLHCEAEDQDGDPLSCTWRCDKPGGFSTAVPLEMTWNGQKWESSFEWGPPKDAVANDIYTLRCEVKDRHGEVLRGQVGAAGRVQILPRGRILFTSTRDGNANVFTMNDDGTDLRRLTNHAADDTMASWTRNGSQIVFTSNRTGRSEVWIMNYDGSGKRKITDGPTMGLTGTSWPTPDPGGYRVAFWGMTPAGRMGVYVITTEGTHPGNPGIPRPLHLGGNWQGDSSVAGANAANPHTARGLAWHPHGLYLVGGGGDLLPPGHAPDLYEFAANGTGHRPLTHTPGVRDNEPGFSHDGRKLAFNRPGQIVIADYTTGALGAESTIDASVTTALESPQFSPDGSRLVTQGMAPIFGRSIFTMRIDGGNARQLTRALGMDDGGQWVYR